MNLPFSHIDALNLLECYGFLTRIDLFVMSIDTSIIRDLVDLKLARSRFLGWEITLEGRRELEEAGVYSFYDTRN